MRPNRVRAALILSPDTPLLYTCWRVATPVPDPCREVPATQVIRRRMGYTKRTFGASPSSALGPRSIPSEPHSTSPLRVYDPGIELAGPISGCFGIPTPSAFEGGFHITRKKRGPRAIAYFARLSSIFFSYKSSSLCGYPVLSASQIARDACDASETRARRLILPPAGPLPYTC